MSEISAAPQLAARIQQVSRQLEASFAPIVAAVGGDAARPTDLARLLKLDKNLTGRVLRALRTSDPLARLHRMPSPQGLRILLGAVRTRVTAELRIAAEAACREFELLIAEQPGGRGALDAAIAGWLPDVRQAGERGASQAIFKATSYLLGYHAQVMAAAHVLQPSEDGGRCDRIDLLLKCGLRRLRSGPPITVTANQLTGLNHDVPTRPRLCTLDGREVSGSEPLTLDEFCTQPLPPLESHFSPSLARFTLGSNQPPINVPVDLVFADLVRDAQLRYQQGARCEEWLETVPRIPCEALVFDVFLRDDLWPECVPSVTPRLYGVVTEPRGRGDALTRLDEVELGAPVVPLGRGISGSHTADITGYVDMLRTVFGRAGWDPERFRGFRCRVLYPVPFISWTMWFDLPPGP